MIHGSVFHMIYANPQFPPTFKREAENQRSILFNLKHN